MSIRYSTTVGAAILGLWLSLGMSVRAEQDEYPLDTCVVSGEKLGGEMGEPIIYDYKGQEVRFCCNGCVKKFNENPEKYLKIIEDAKKAKSTETEPTKP
jgi:YHS domain-containing protein